MSNDDNDVQSTSLGTQSDVEAFDVEHAAELEELRRRFGGDDERYPVIDERGNAGADLLASVPERVFGDDEASGVAPAPLTDEEAAVFDAAFDQELARLRESGFTDADDEAEEVLDLDVVTPEPKPQIQLDAQQQVMVSRWVAYANRQPATPVEEHELLTAVSEDVVLRDYLIVSVLHDWLSDRIDNVPSTFSGKTALSEALEETLGRCANDSPEKSACQVMLFTARLAEQMPRSGQDFMKALSWMSEDDVAMLVEAGSFASPELSEYINVLVQSVAVTKVTR